jgi:hypothetical protein
MKRTIAVMVAAVVFGACGGSSDSTDDTTEETVETTSPETTSPDTTVPDTTVPDTEAPETTAPSDTAVDDTALGGDGEEFIATDGGFAVDFDGEPTLQEQATTLPTGESLTVPFYLVEQPDGAQAASCLSYPDPSTVVDLEGAREGAVAGMGGSLIDSAPIELQGRQGLEFTGSLASLDGYLEGRVFDTGGGVCQVFVIGEGDEAPPEALAFLDSFRFLEGG